jgi:hypothetical protein
MKGMSDIEQNNENDWLSQITPIERAHWDAKSQSTKDWWYANTKPDARGQILRTEISIMAKQNEFLHLPETERAAILKRMNEKANAARERLRKRGFLKPD